MTLLEVVEKYPGRVISFRGQDAFVSNMYFEKNELSGRSELSELEVNYIRAGDDGSPETIEKYAYVNRLGSIVTVKPILFDQQDLNWNKPNYLELTSEEKELIAESLQQGR